MPPVAPVEQVRAQRPGQWPGRCPMGGPGGDHLPVGRLALLVVGALVGGGRLLRGGARRA